MLNILHTKTALADCVKENVLNKITIRIVYNGDKETCLKLEVTDTLDLKDTLRTHEHDVLYEKRNQQLFWWYLQKEGYKDSLCEYGMWC